MTGSVRAWSPRPTWMLVRAKAAVWANPRARSRTLTKSGYERTPVICGGPFGNWSSSCTRISRVASDTAAGGRNSSASTIPNITVFAPMPIANVRTATNVKPGAVRSLRTP